MLAPPHQTSISWARRRELETELGQRRLRNTASSRNVLAEAEDGARSSPEADLMNEIRVTIEWARRPN